MIELRDLRKEYRVHRREPGLRAALASVLHRRYERVTAVDGISFRIDDGACVAFLGPNGAGKTTTLKMLAGVLHPTSGSATVHGHTPSRREAAFLRRITLVLGQKQQLLWDLPPSETFELNRALYDVPRAQFRQTMSELVELLELGDLVRQPTRQLSLGERMKCELAAALVHRPEVLFLDEPTIGLDVTMQVTIRKLVKRYSQQFGATLLLTSHCMDDVTALCQRVIVIDRGQISHDGSLEALSASIRPEKRIALRFGAPVSRAALEALGEVTSYAAGEATLRVATEDVSQAVARALARFDVRDLSVASPPLDEVLQAHFARTRLVKVCATERAAS